MDRFWMLFAEGGGAPIHQHTSPESAKTETERLTRLLGKRVFVLETVAVVKRVDVQWTKLREPEPSKNDDIPF